MLNLLHAKTFLKVLDERGLRAASRSLNLAPSTVLDHIAQLEKELAARLIVRTNGSIIATAEGEVFRPLAMALVTTAEKARHLISTGPLRLAASSNIGVYLLQPYLSSFRSADTAETELWIGSNPDVRERLKRGQADLAIVEQWFDMEGFEAHFWLPAPLTLIVSPQHPWAGRVSISPQELVQQRILGGEEATGTGKLLRDQLGIVADRLTVVDGFGSTEAVKRAVRANLGISIVMTASVCDEVKSGSLISLQFEGVRIVKQTKIVMPRGMPPSAPSRRFLAQATNKPGALRNGAPFAEMPPAFRSLQQHLLKRPGGDREMVEILSLVLQHDEQVVLTAVELALQAGVPTKTHIINLLHRLIDGTPLSTPTIPAPPALTLTTEPQANVERYDALRRAREARHAS
jgi:DNA-binding transcriptional LysR family regulator